MGRFLQKLSPKIIILFLVCFILSELIFLIFKSGVITLTVRSNKSLEKEVAGVESVSTNSAVIKTQKSAQLVGEEVTSSSSKIPQGQPREMTVACVIDTNCGGGEKILPLSVCENSVCCLENGTYIQYWDRKSCGDANGSLDSVGSQQNKIYVPQVFNSPSIPVEIVYVPVYLEAYGTTYNCNINSIEKIQQADDEYSREMKEVAEICARSDASYYGSCLNKCIDTEEFDVCSKSCYEQSYGRCSINPVDSPEYRQLEFVMGMYCK